CVGAGRIEEGLGLAERATEAASRLDAQAEAALALARAGDGERAKALVRTLSETARTTAGTAGATALAKAVAACGVWNEAAAADAVEKEALALAPGAPSEPDRLDALIALIDTLNTQGSGDRTVNMITACEDVARRGVMIAALAQSVAADTANLE